MRARSVIALSSLALLAAGCSAAPEQATTADSTVSAVVESSPATVADADANANSGQAWADSKIEMWKENSGIKSIKRVFVSLQSNDFLGISIPRHHQYLLGQQHGISHSNAAKLRNQ